MRTRVCQRNYLLGLLLVSLWLLAACGTPIGPTTTAPAPVTPPGHTPTPAVRPTLPPTWTPTDTLTPVPPTVTPTVTRTPTITPTPDDAGRCAALVVLGHPQADARLVYARPNAFTFMWNYPLFEGTVILTIKRVGTTLEQIIPVPGPETVVASIPRRALYGPGIYEWSIAPLGEDGEPLTACQLTGRFTLLLRERTAQPLTPEP